MVWLLGLVAVWFISAEGGFCMFAMLLNDGGFSGCGSFLVCYILRGVGIIYLLWVWPWFFGFCVITVL